MKFEKKAICSLTKCYSIAAFEMNGKKNFLVAAEKQDPCYLFDEDGNKLETVWERPGGVMTMVQVPGRDDQFLATHKFFSPNDSKEAKIVIATRLGENNWEVRTLVEAPFVHRFGLLERNGVTYLIVCCLKSGHDYKEDWTKPGATYAAVLPNDLSQFNSDNQLKLEKIKENMGHNHGFSKIVINGQERAIVACDSGVWKFTPPEKEDGEWSEELLYEAPVSDAVLLDLDGDGRLELGCISPFHGDQLYICHLNDQGTYEKVWQYPEPLEFLHSTWACTLQGKPYWIVGNRKGNRNLMVIGYQNGTYQPEMVDHDCGSANSFKFTNSKNEEVIISANREINEIALFYVR